jgi:hypothetical protein
MGDAYPRIDAMAGLIQRDRTFQSHSYQDALAKDNSTSGDEIAYPQTKFSTQR